MPAAASPAPRSRSRAAAEAGKRRPIDAHARVDRRDELGEHGDLLPPPQRARARAAGRAALGPAAALVVRFRGGGEAPACGRLGRLRRPAGRRREPARARRRRGAGAVHQHHAQAGERGAGGGRDPAAAYRRRDGARHPPRPVPPPSPAGYPLHHGAGILQRPPARPARRSRRSCRTRPGASSCTGSSTTSCAGRTVRAGIQGRLSARDRSAAARRRRWHHPRLHRDHHADREVGHGSAVFDTTRIHAEAAMDFALGDAP